MQTRRGRDLDAEPMELWGQLAASMRLDRELVAQDVAVLALVYAAAGQSSRAKAFDDIVVSLGIRVASAVRRARRLGRAAYSWSHLATAPA